MDGISEGEIVLVKCKCRSQFCPDCMPGLMVSMREKIRPALLKWKSVQMLTMTVSRDVAEGPREAYEMIQAKRLVAETVRSFFKRGWLHSREFVYVIEFHKDGWPHWHCLVDVKWVKHEDFKKRWKYGHVFLSPKGKFENNSHAINYCTKYISKADNPFPDWVLDYSGNLRRFSTSRGLTETKKKVRREKPDEPKRVRNRKTPRERTASCGNDSVFYEKINGKLKFIETTGLPFELVQGLSWAEVKEIQKRVAAETRSSDQKLERIAKQAVRNFLDDVRESLPPVVEFHLQGGSLSDFLRLNPMSEMDRSRTMLESLLFAQGHFESKGEKSETPNYLRKTQSENPVAIANSPPDVQFRFDWTPG